MADGNPEYIPPTYGKLFQDSYLTSHRQKMQLAIQLAQQELQTQQAMLAYYQKKEKEYLEYIEEVGTAGAGRSAWACHRQTIRKTTCCIETETISDPRRRET